MNQPSCQRWQLQKHQPSSRSTDQKAMLTGKIIAQTSQEQTSTNIFQTNLSLSHLTEKSTVFLMLLKDMELSTTKLLPTNTSLFQTKQQATAAWTKSTTLQNSLKLFRTCRKMQKLLELMVS